MTKLREIDALKRNIAPVLFGRPQLARAIDDFVERRRITTQDIADIGAIIEMVVTPPDQVCAVSGCGCAAPQECSEGPSA